LVSTKREERKKDEVSDCDFPCTTITREEEDIWEGFLIPNDIEEGKTMKKKVIPSDGERWLERSRVYKE